MTVLLDIWTDPTLAGEVGVDFVALAGLCAIAYAVYLLSADRNERAAAQMQRALDSTVDRLNHLESERVLADSEARVLRRLAAATSIDEAVGCLFDTCLNDADHGCAVFVALDANGALRECWARGLTGQSQRNLMLDREWLTRLENEPAFRLPASAVRRSQFVESLAEFDRDRIEQLILVRAGDSVPPDGVLLTTHLRPERASFAGRLELAQRLAGSMSSCLRRTEALHSQQDELRLTRERLGLRCLVDSHLGSPVELLEEFLQRVCGATGFDRATLHLTSNARLDTKPLVRTGAALARGIADLWKLDEAVLARRGLKASGLLFFDAADLHALRVRSTMCTALVGPLVHEETLIGVVTLSREADDPISEVERDLLRWAAEFLTETILKTIDRAIIEQQARKDALTRLANRHTFDREIREHIDQAIASGEDCSLILLDVDRFKLLNDRFGHLAGDEVLRNLSRVIQKRVAHSKVSEKRLVARYGGEELAVLLPGVGLQQAVQMAEDLVDAVGEAETRFDNQLIRTTISAGVAVCPRHGRTPEALIAAADRALYRAKQNGRNRTEIADVPIECVSR